MRTLTFAMAKGPLVYERGYFSKNDFSVSYPKEIPASKNSRESMREIDAPDLSKRTIGARL